MVRFSCFSPSGHHHRSKRSVQYASGAIHLNPQATSQDQTIKIPMDSANSNLKTDNNNLLATSMEKVASLSSHEGCCKSEELFNYSCLKDSKDYPQMVRLKKSQSLGNVLDENRYFFGDDVTEDGEMDHGFSFQHSQDQNMKRFTNSVDNTGSFELHNHKDSGVNFCNQNQETGMVESFDAVTDTTHHEPLFSIGVLEQSDGEHHDDDGEQSTDCVANSEQFSSDVQPVLAKSCSASNLRVNSENSIGGDLNSELVVPRSKSHQNLSSIDGRREKFVDADEELHFGVTSHEHKDQSFSQSIPQASALDGKSLPHHASIRKEYLRSDTSGYNEVADQERDLNYLSEKSKSESQSKDGKWSPGHGGSGEECHLSNSSAGLPKVAEEANQERDGKFWCKKPDCETESGGIGKRIRQGSSVQSWDELSPQEFSVRRIEDWISQIDIQNDNIVEDVGESSSSVSKEHPRKVPGVTTKFDAKSSLGTEVAFSYISGMKASSSTAQMANLGLVAIPVLSAFVGLRAVNLSGNAIVHITAGVLPKGLHMLNLSKNNISAIEGLRELTRLRILDLSYNRISRIGHGLASCSSLKELYLAGNKISEVEGLHRLLKLNILDLRSNKISTSKGLGQLAANYGSLQAIILEGNPAQMHVGDEQLKKCLLGLLPRLIYYNKQAIRSSGSKEISDHPPRSRSTHQFDRSTRSEYKHSRRAALGSGLHKSSSSLIRPGQSVNSLLKLAKNSNGHLPPAGFKPNGHISYIDRNLSSLHSGKPIRRVCSDGMLRESVAHA